LTDIIHERQQRVDRLNDLRIAGEDEDFRTAVQTMREATDNLYLIALGDAVVKLCTLARVIVFRRLNNVSVGDDVLSLRDRLIRHIDIEYDRLEEYLPRAQRRADETRRYADDVDDVYDDDNAEHDADAEYEMVDNGYNEHKQVIHTVTRYD